MHHTREAKMPCITRTASARGKDPVHHTHCIRWRQRCNASHALHPLDDSKNKGNGQRLKDGNGLVDHRHLVPAFRYWYSFACAPPSKAL